MDNFEFEQFVLESGKEILKFCIMTAGNEDRGNELYQDTMLKLLEKKGKLDSRQNVKSYALSVSILLWRNKKKKYSVRKNKAPTSSLEAYEEENGPLCQADEAKTPEQQALERSNAEMVRGMVAALPEKYRLPLYLAYSADLKMEEIASCLGIPANTVKTRIRKAKRCIKEKLEALGYDR